MTSPGPCSDGGLLRGGSDAPQGTNVDQTWVDVFNGRGRRSPLVSRPEGRPGEGAAAADFVDETVKTGDSVGCVRRDIAETGRCPSVSRSRMSVVIGRRKRAVMMTLTNEGERRRRWADTDTVLAPDFRPQGASLPLVH